jgi:hypothetical protein
MGRFRNLAVFGRKNVTFQDIFALVAKVKQLSGLLSTISENGFVLRGMAVPKATKKARTTTVVRAFFLPNFLLV